MKTCKTVLARSLLKAALLVLAAAVLLGSCALADGGWTCPNCGRENSEEANFCGNCRTPRPHETLALDNLDANAWICSSCGRIVSSEDVFCINCAADHLASDASAVLVTEPATEDIWITPVTIQEYPASVSAGTLTLAFEAPVSGQYHCWISGQTADMEFRTAVLDGSGNSLYRESFFHNYSTATFECGERERFTVEVQNNGRDGTYCLCVGIPNAPTFLGGAGLIHDSMLFEDQVSLYRFTPDISGRFALVYTEGPNGLSIKPRILDSAGYNIVSSSFGMNRGSYLSADLEAGETYTIEVRQHSELGEFTLTLGRPQPIPDISGCGGVGDTVRFPGQQNSYTFTAAETGRYRFTLSQTKSGNEFSTRVRDAEGYTVNSSSYMREGSWFEADLTIGRQYTLTVEQRDGYGSYSILINKEAD